MKKKKKLTKFFLPVKEISLTALKLDKIKSDFQKPNLFIKQKILVRGYLSKLKCLKHKNAFVFFCKLEAGVNRELVRALKSIKVLFQFSRALT